MNATRLSNPFRGAVAASAAALLCLAGAAPGWTQQRPRTDSVAPVNQPRLPSSLPLPPRPATPAGVAPVTAPPISPVRPLAGVAPPTAPPIRLAPPPVRTVKPVVVPPVLAPQPLGVASLAGPHPLSPAPAPIILTAPPPVRSPGMASWNPAGSPSRPLACDPMSAMLSTGSVCIGPYIFSLETAGNPSFAWTPPPFLAAATYGAFGSLWPSLTVPLCSLCTGPVSGPAGPAIPVDPVLLRKFLSPIETSRLVSRGILPGLAPFQTVSRSEPPAAAPSAATIVRPSRTPFFFILRDGTTDLVSRYTLEQDWLLHYVTVSGQQKAVSIQQLDLDATASANFARGVPFSLPGWPAPAPRH